MNDKTFIDTNIFVYCFDNGSPEKKKKAIEIVEGFWENSKGVLSFQVLKEFFVTVTEKLPNKMDLRDAKAAVIDLLTWEIFHESKSSFEKSLQIVERYRLSFWDANIVSAAILSDCAQIFSEDLRHRQTIEGVKIVNPFVSGQN